MLCSFQDLTSLPHFTLKFLLLLPLVDFQSPEMVVLKDLFCSTVAVWGKIFPTSSLCQAFSPLIFYMDKNSLLLYFTVLFYHRLFAGLFSFFLKYTLEKFL